MNLKLVKASLDYHDFDKYCEGIEVKDASEGKG